MDSIRRQYFKNAVEQVCNNWTALQLAIEHGMAGPNSSEVAVQLIEYVTNMCCTKSNVSVEDVEDALLDILEDEFNTVCEDDSPKEVAFVLIQLLSTLKQGNLEVFQLEMAKLPTRTKGSSPNSSANIQPVTSRVAEIVESDEMDIEAEEEEGWTTIKGKRKK